MRHPSQEELLAWIDGELPVLSRLRVIRHTERCWDCRCRAADFNDSIRRLREAATHTEIDRVDVARAKWRLITEMSSQVPAPRQTGRWNHVWYFAFAALSMTCAAAFWLARPPVRTRPHATETALQVVTRLEAEETQVSAAVVRDEFDVAIAAGAGWAARWEWKVWASSDGRYEARWRNSKANLTYAVFASSPGSGYLYATGTGLQPITPPGPHSPAMYQAVAPSDGDLRNLENGFLSWISRQQWRPVSLAREIATFCTREGATLRVERLGPKTVWSATAVRAGGEVRMKLEALKGKRPQVLELSWRSGGQTRVIRIERRGHAEYGDMRMAGVTFRPEPEMLARRAEVPPAVTAPVNAVVAATPLALDDTEFEVWKVLHELRLCLTGEIQVHVARDGVVLSGYLADGEKRSQLMSLLDRLPSHNLIRVQIRWPGDAAGSGGEQPVPLPAEASPAAPPESAAPVPPGENWLRAHLAGRGVSDRQIFDIMGGTVRTAENLAAESWALRRLGERYTPEAQLALSDGNRLILRSMAADHVSAMQVAISNLWRTIDVSSPQLELPVRSREPWQTGAPVLQQRANRITEQILSVFAVTGQPETESVDNQISALRVRLTMFAGEADQERAAIEKN